MKLTKKVEQAACILTLLATQEQDIPLSSELIHTRLGGSSSYLKKIMRKLVVGKIVHSIPGTNGGFTVSRLPSQISMYELVTAVEGEIQSYRPTGIIDNVFADIHSYVKDGNKIISQVFDEADEKWVAALKQHSVNELLLNLLHVSQVPKIDWNESISSPEDFRQQLLDNLKIV
ncbi:RrF2 family transcriptional regulator [Paucilactobacillus nenjiangensis]|uniref:Rrf2 family transcriptional regulator n=1 Tax=Paucilactobacillus nenjiangensis TaxID=1296540 RepID=A0A5P1X3V6_9LACO|nr:Rrf2 family transcriptional regulator [Paucilactobacillus nenjiangensis]QER66988.1 Rrf2 family transcriptional regulator [Paucilactobacillus nenjiangensis]